MGRNQYKSLAESYSTDILMLDPKDAPLGKVVKEWWKTMAMSSGPSFNWVEDELNPARWTDKDDPDRKETLDEILGLE